MTIVREAADRLASWGVPIDSVHHEAGPGQYEIDIAALPALRLRGRARARQADRCARSPTQRGCAHLHAAPALRRGRLGPAPAPARRARRSSDRDGALTDDGRAFLAGQLAHARGSRAPWPLRPSTRTSGCTRGPEAPSAAVWAHVNRGALVRLSPDHGGRPDARVPRRGPLGQPVPAARRVCSSPAAHGLGEPLELAPAFEEEFGRLRSGRRWTRARSSRSRAISRGARRAAGGRRAG